MYQEGQTAINPKTGQRVVFRNGQWVIGTPIATVAKPLNAAEQKSLIEKRDDARKLKYTANRLSNVDKYLDQGVATGPFYGLPGADLFMGENLQQIEAISNELAPQQRAKGSGSTSDIEYRGMKLSLPSANLYGNVNRQLIKDIKNKSRESQAYIAFMDAYAAKNGTLNGADTAFDAFWADYTSNPKKYTQPKPQGLAAVAQPQQPRPIAQPAQTVGKSRILSVE